MSRQARIHDKIQEALKPQYLLLENESAQHSVPADSETHFKLLVVSEKFLGLSRVERQRQVYQPLDEEFKSGLHALTVKALTPEEWKPEQEKNFVSPTCRGGSGH